MIKRRFYRLEHGERDGDVDSPSSSSESEPKSESESESESGVLAKGSDEDSDAVGNEVEDENDRGEQTLPRVPLPESSSSSGYESEDSSGDELDPEGNSADEECIGKKIDGKKFIDTDVANGSQETARREPKTPLPDNLARCILKHKSVFKCKICPKIVCLNEDSLRTHLESKRHSRSEKLLNDGRLKRILNNNGEEIILEEDGETHAERYARTLASTQDQPKKKVGGRQRQKERRKRKGINNSNEEAPKQGRESLPKKRRKNI